ncbi:MAG TPA: tetratricopeptide repeat protein [Polyangiaceae bacterium]|jgi:tetratricopeptide (TPR) repeat protein|nr:tetratricopeptide repeat protein [Polyangiaceae bacterium]
MAPLVVTFAHAQSSFQGRKPPPEAVKAAQNHMTKARALYEAGNYPDAIAELETARALDPYAKDLVFNLGIVHEKALHFDEALHFYRLYLEMDIEPAERAKAENIIKRLEGARTHVPPTSTATSTVAPPATTIIVNAGSPPHGRMDGLTVVSGLFALAGFGVGAGFGIAALGARPPAPYVTGGAGDPNANGTYADLKAMVDRANTLAIIADIGFLTGIVFTGVTLGVYFGRTKKVTVSPMGRGIAIGGTF